MAKYARIVNDIVDSVGPNPCSGCTLVPDNVWGGDAYYGSPPVHVPRPSSQHVWDFDNKVFVLDYDQFNPLLNATLANEREMVLYSLSASVTADTFKKVGSSFELLNEDVVLEIGLDDRTESALQTKVHITSNAPEPKAYERFKFKNEDVYVFRDTFSSALIQLDAARQPVFDAVGATLDRHYGLNGVAEVKFTSFQDATDYFHNLLGIL